MAERLSPIVNELGTPFWMSAAEGRLVRPFCQTTDCAFWPPSPSSPFVTGGAVAWRDVAPEGTVVSVVIYRRAFQRALADRLPYGVALVEVRPGVRLQAHVADPDGLDAPSPGDRVALGFQPMREGEPGVLCVAAPSENFADD